MYGYSPHRAARRAEETDTFGMTLTEDQSRARWALAEAEFEKTCPPHGLPRLKAKLLHYFGVDSVRMPRPPQFDIPRG